jgi:lipid A ethanolaminephosphotransferase
VLVLGETATAAHFSLNGYERDTNPELSTRQVVNFPDVTACATSTADALPRIFSGLTREECSDLDFDLDDRETLLDVLQRVGVSVLWKDNNSGCKGVCERVRYEEATGPPELQNDGAVYDEALLVGLQAELDREPGDLFLVLHQKGSHGRPTTAARRRLSSASCPSARATTCSAARGTRSSTPTTTRSSTPITCSRWSSTSSPPTARRRRSRCSTSPTTASRWRERHLPARLPLLAGAVRADARADALLGLARVLRGPRPVARRSARRERPPYSHDNVFHTILGAFDVRTASYDASLDLLEPAPRS